MNNSQINELMQSLSMTMNCFETLLIENDGEYTEEAEQMDEQITILKELLTTEGVDSLGRWLKSKEDEIKTLKAEKDYIMRRINASNNTIDYIKGQLHRVLKASGMTEVKGANGYKFQVTKSQTTSVDKDVLNEMYKSKVLDAISGVIPEDVTITLGASVSLVPEGTDLPSYYNVTEKDTCKFTKPRAKKTE